LNAVQPNPVSVYSIQWPISFNSIQCLSHLYTYDPTFQVSKETTLN